VLDTNVLISAFVFPGGALEHVYRRVLDGQAMLSGDRHLRGLGRGGASASWSPAVFMDELG
jgi:hypothetical protein